MALTRMIFAIQMTDPRPTRLRVRGNVGTPAPALTKLRRGYTQPSSVGCVDGSWTMDLDAGDYLIEIQVEEWVAGRLDIAAELAPGQSPPTFIYQGPLQQSSPGGLAAWKATAVYVDPPESSTAFDSKDPWPPPPPPPTSTITLAQDSSAWFTDELAAARARIASQGAGRALPPSVLDALVTGR
jgi:hypothetical protein